jgi:6-phosphogluconolactonase
MSAPSFPDTPALRETRRVLAIPDSPKPPPRRVTLSLPVLQAARVVCVAAFGESKAEALRAALRDPLSTLPVALVARGARHALFLLDPPAGKPGFLPASSLLGAGPGSRDEAGHAEAIP